MKKTKPKILGVVTARGGSKGLPGKNIRPLGGKPLIVWTLECARKSKMLSRVIVSTDYEDIAKVARDHGGDVPFMRPKKFAEDNSGSLEVVQHALRELEKIGEKYDYVVILQPTSPFRKPEYIDDVLKKMIDLNAESGVTLIPVTKDHPIKIKKLVNDHVVGYAFDEPATGMRRQDWPEAYKRSGDVYAMTHDLVMKKNRLYGENTVGVVVDAKTAVDIDDMADWLYAEYIYNTLYGK